MTRGRKKDLTIPPTRSLVQQRDYRARKAQFVSELESRVKVLEEENARLRQELELAHANMSVPLIHHPAATDLATELAQNLELAQKSLYKFQEFARRHPVAASANSPSSSRLESVRLPPLQDSPQHPSPLPPMHTIARSNGHDVRHPSSGNHHPFSPLRGRKRFCREDSPSDSPPPPPNNSVYEKRDYPPHHHHQQPASSASEEGDSCCGGYFDCDRFYNARGPPPAPLNSHERTVPFHSSRPYSHSRSPQMES